MKKRTALLASLLFALGFVGAVSCGDDDNDDGSSDSDTDTDTDTDTDADTDSDTGLCTEGCHGHPPATGSHGHHAGTLCFTCHGTVVSSGEDIIDVEAHTDGIPDITPGDGTYESGVCSNTGCHGMPIAW